VGCHEPNETEISELRLAFVPLFVVIYRHCAQVQPQSDQSVYAH
jgi:hypothetical protein